MVILSFYTTIPRQNERFSFGVPTGSIAVRKETDMNRRTFAPAHPSSPRGSARPYRRALSTALCTALCNIALAGCGLGLELPDPAASSRPAVAPEQIAEVEEVEEIEEVQEVALPPLELPSSLTCASDELAPDDGSRVVRASIWLGEGSSGVLSFGPAFFTHNVHMPPPAETSETDLGAVSVVEADGISSIDTAAGTFILEQHGAFWSGVLDQPHVIVDIVCWNDAEVFGNAWSGDPGLLTARFDWQTGDCRDASGEPAQNELPIAFVRETRFGDCADLRGAMLNGTDYLYPQLEGFSLAGADLTGASLFFADLRWAFLAGANLAGLEYGYANIDGQVDERTLLPTEGCVVTEGDFGDTVACLR
jgi:Pentapeptide repeats (8 copies)